MAWFKKGKLRNRYLIHKTKFQFPVGNSPALHVSISYSFLGRTTYSLFSMFSVFITANLGLGFDLRYVAGIRASVFYIF